MEDITEGLDDLCFESGLTGDDRMLIPLRARRAKLTFSGCAHAAFLCDLVHSLRCMIGSRAAGRSRLASGEVGDFCVGILGLGHLGKQLLLTLLEKTSLKPAQIKISTRRPELAGDFVKKGVECFFDNGRLAAAVDLLFLCCLPSQLSTVCPVVRSHLPKHVLVYSFASAVPVTRLSNFLRHDFIIKPQYDFAASDTTDVWKSCPPLMKALSDPSLIEASLSMDGGLNLKWTCAVCSMVNICTSAAVGSTVALSLINKLLNDRGTHTAQLDAHIFVTSLSLHPDEPFPWISLVDCQTKETPLQNFLSHSRPMQQVFSAAYTSLLQKPSEQ